MSSLFRLLANAHIAEKAHQIYDPIYQDEYEKVYQAAYKDNYQNTYQDLIDQNKDLTSLIQKLNDSEETLEILKKHPDPIINNQIKKLSTDCMEQKTQILLFVQEIAQKADKIVRKKIEKRATKFAIEDIVYNPHITPSIKTQLKDVPAIKLPLILEKASKSIKKADVNYI